MRIHELFEEASAGGTSAGDIPAVPNPHIAIGKRDKSYAGSPGKPGTKAPRLPKITQLYNPDGTAQNALDISANLMGGPAVIKRKP